MAASTEEVGDNSHEVFNHIGTNNDFACYHTLVFADGVAYVDPLGAQTPRIKVQVKHKPDAAIGAADVRALLGILKAGDIALFVTSGMSDEDKNMLLLKRISF